MQFLTPDITVTPPAVVQGVRRLPAIDYAGPGRPVTSLRLEALRNVPTSMTHGLSTAPGSPASVLAKRMAPSGGATVPARAAAGGLSRAGGASRFRPAAVIPGTSSRVSTAPVRVYFATDSARLTVAAIRQLRALPRGACYTVVGHADPRPVGVAGSYRFNLALSARRALAVARVLDDRGDRVTVEARSWIGASTRPSQYRFDRRAVVLVAARRIAMGHIAGRMAGSAHNARRGGAACNEGGR
ncbi:MAG: hypothetical protein M0Z85_11440 [Gammaproteobacteria bacterium]|nr:hypothetical protein [Gammaproteobacteria bacterium]